VGTTIFEFQGLAFDQDIEGAISSYGLVLDVSFEKVNGI
jgi:hypothetical protein